MVAINAAWELIGTRTRRAAYDRDRRARPSRGDTDGAAVVGARREPRRPATAAGRDRRRGPRPAVRRRRTAAGARLERLDDGSVRGRRRLRRGTMRAPEGLGAAGPPPGNPSGTVLNFGRYAGWSLGEIARTDIDYIEWLDRMPIGRAVPRRDRRDPAAGRAGDAARRPRRTTDKACSGGAETRARTSRSTQPGRPAAGVRPLPLRACLPDVDALEDAEPDGDADQRRAAVGDERQRDAGDRHDPDDHARG